MIRIALIGCAESTTATSPSAYAEACRRVPNARFVAAVNSDLAAARRTADLLGTSCAAVTLDDFLAGNADSIDAVFLSSESGPHGENVKRAAGAGKHVFAEAPLALSVRQADQMIDTCRSAGVRLMVGKPLRFLEAHRNVKDSLVSGKLGSPGLLRIHHWDAAGPGSRETKAVSRVVQDLDLASWLFESLPTEVYAVAGDKVGADKVGADKVGADKVGADYVQVHLGFPEGGMALIDCSILTDRPDYYSLSVIGSKGAAYVDDHHNMNLVYRRGEPSALKVGYGNGHIAAQLAEFVDSLAGDREPAPGGAEERAAIEVAEAVAESIESGRAARRTGGSYELT